MRLCLPARMGGGGKTGIDSLERASGQSPPHGGIYSGLGTRGQSPWRSLERSAAPAGATTSRVSGSQKRRPRTARRRRAMCRQAECATRLLHHRCSATDASERATGARPARREMRAPAGQHKNGAPAGARSAGPSASSTIPLIISLLPIVTRTGRDYRPGSRSG
jgi:hypothetical protein